MKRATVAVIIGSTLLLAIAFLYWSFSQPLPDYSNPAATGNEYWVAPDTLRLPDDDTGRLIRYGRQLIAHTAVFYGPRGSIAKITNGMNCQNCHLDAGTRIFGNNLSAVASGYPKFRERKGAYESEIERINDCFERSLNGKAIDSNSREMKAILTYFKWINTNALSSGKRNGAGIRNAQWMDRAADSALGRVVYFNKCQTCHKEDGQGVLADNGLEYTYPPLWGAHSYNIGAGLYRLERFAGFVQDNMPNGSDYTHPQLSYAEAWDVAAFVNSRPRPGYDLRKDWPNIAAKPVDCPFGPYKDTFTEAQHKYGPFLNMLAQKKKHS